MEMHLHDKGLCFLIFVISKKLLNRNVEQFYSLQINSINYVNGR